MKLNTIIHSDCRSELQNLPGGSADLIFANFPSDKLHLKNALYRLDNTGVVGVDDDWDRFFPFIEYDDFCKAWRAKSKHGVCKKYALNHRPMKKYNGGEQMRSVWQISICARRGRLRGMGRKKLHSTEKTEVLLKRAILSTTKQGDVVLDPFFGTSTIKVVAKKLKHNYIGTGKDVRYVSLQRTESMASRLSLMQRIGAEETIGKTNL